MATPATHLLRLVAMASADSSSRGAYTAERASALSGVPLSTVRYWAKHEILVPTASNERPLLWSYSDLLGLRTIYWLRRQKSVGDGVEIPAATMLAVRTALQDLAHLSWDSRVAFGIAVDGGGRLYFRRSADEPFATTRGQLSGPWVDLIAPFETAAGIRAPDLRRPRPSLRIEPAKLTGSPHIVGTRVETLALFALRDRGLNTSEIRLLYPFLDEQSVVEALQFEEQLASNLRTAA